MANSLSPLPGSIRRNSPIGAHPASRSLSASVSGSRSSRNSSTRVGRPWRVEAWPSNGSSCASRAIVSVSGRSTVPILMVAPDPSTSEASRARRRSGAGQSRAGSRPSRRRCASISSSTANGARIASDNLTKVSAASAAGSSVFFTAASALRSRSSRPSGSSADGAGSARSSIILSSPPASDRVRHRTEQFRASSGRRATGAASASST
jgi:hypothetical protein